MHCLRKIHYFMQPVRSSEDPVFYYAEIPPKEALGMLDKFAGYTFMDHLDKRRHSHLCDFCGKIIYEIKLRCSDCDFDVCETCVKFYEHFDKMKLIIVNFNLGKDISRIILTDIIKMSFPISYESEK